MTHCFENSDGCVKDIIERVGTHLVVATPLGLGKPVQFLNALYKEAQNNSEIQLTIITALSLSKPAAKHKLAKSLISPIVERLYGNYYELEYEIDRRKKRLPKNVRIIEFYLSQGAYINNATAQQDYISSNYTHVIRDILSYGVNIFCQLVVQNTKKEFEYSLSCNADLTEDFRKHIDRLETHPIFVGEVNPNLPFMYGQDAILTKDDFDYLLDTKTYSSLFQIPRPPVSNADFMIGFYGSTLVKDGSCIEIGIGSLSESLCANLIFRHGKNSEYFNFIHLTDTEKKFKNLIEKIGDTTAFQEGLFASSEMLVDGFIDLYKNGILQKKVYDDCPLQHLLNQKKISEDITPAILDVLLQFKYISATLTQRDVEYLKHYGIFKQDIEFSNGYLQIQGNEKIVPNLEDSATRQKINTLCLGTTLKEGKVAHGGFFIGSQALYSALANMSDEEKKLFDMRSIQKINHLYHNEELKRLQKTHARHINTCMKVTLLGGVISDTIDNSTVISGVGGQYNFVSMAHELEDGRSIIFCRSTYTKKGKVHSNIVWENDSLTIPRHLRDIIVTEYGIADCRSKTDSEVIKAILNITDSRFQKKLLQTAKKFGKISNDYQIPIEFQNNFPNTINLHIEHLKKIGIYQRYPFGSDFTLEERSAEELLSRLNTMSSSQLFISFFKGLIRSSKPLDPVLNRLGLYSKKSISNFIYIQLLKGLNITF